MSNKLINKVKLAFINQYQKLIFLPTNFKRINVLLIFNFLQKFLHYYINENILLVILFIDTYNDLFSYIESILRLRSYLLYA